MEEERREAGQTTALIGVTTIWYKPVGKWAAGPQKDRASGWVPGTESWSETRRSLVTGAAFALRSDHLGGYRHPNPA